MPRRKFATDEERIAAIRDYHKRYYEAHRDTITNRSRQWRAARRNVAPPAPQAQVDVAA